MKKNGQWHRLPDKLARGEGAKVAGLVKRDRSADGPVETLESPESRSNVFKIL